MQIGIVGDFLAVRAQNTFSNYSAEFIGEIMFEIRRAVLELWTEGTFNAYSCPGHG